MKYVFNYMYYTEIKKIKELKYWFQETKAVQKEGFCALFMVA